MFEELRARSLMQARAVGGVLGAALVALGACGCATHPGFERLANGDLRVACNAALADCLLPAADACAAHGFDVVAATERRETTGAPTEQANLLHSEATVPCRRAVPLFGHDPNEPTAPRVVIVSGSASAVPAAAPRCVPGTSQACAKTTGCSGAQVCVADGTHFGSCECAAAPPVSRGATLTDGGAE